MATKEKTFAVKLAESLELIETTQAAVSEAESAYTLAKQALKDLLKELPADHPLRSLATAAAANGKPAAVSSGGKRSRMTAQQLEELQGEIITQLKANSEPVGRSGFDMGDYDPTKWMQQVAKLVKAGKVKQIGEKSKAVYTVGKK